MRDTLRRWRRDALTLALLSAPFALLVAACLAGAELAQGWASLDYVVWALVAGGAWAAAVVGFLAWTVIRDGWQPSAAPAIVVLCGVGVLAAGWGYLEFAEERECRAADQLYARLTAGTAAGGSTEGSTERAAAIRDGGRLVTHPSPCALDALLLNLGRDPALPADARSPSGPLRRAVLAELLQAGLPPADRLLYEYAVGDADAEAVRLLLRRRRVLIEELGADWNLFPDDIVRLLIERARSGPAAERYRATLGAFVQEGLPDPSILTDWTEDRLRALGLLP